ncbi:hypothetical protein [Arthrobacter castelli]|uniref:hypothetical protein n=1 Tax=Arthrobacter castelli TaxID=271431 RepID=UPI00042293DF|nr:hypothetical protein [Arthrobacter castelli]
MAQLKGKGAFTGVNLVAKTFDNNVTKDGKTRFLDVQVDHRDERGKSETNLHLTSNRTVGDDGQTRYNNGAPYSAGQFDKIAEAAGPNVEPIANADGEKIGQLYGVKANVMPSAKGNGLVLNSESLGGSDFDIDSQTMDGQFSSMREARDARATEQQATAEPAAEQTAGVEAETERVAESEEPQLG